MTANLIILFAKSPVPGRVKTRLLSVLTPGLAAELHSAFVLDLVERFRRFPGADFQLHTDTCSDAWQSLGVTRKVQISGDLGLKMVHGLQQALEAGSSRALILGSDSPTVPSGHIRELLEMDADVALGPAADGGFYAISARRADPAMFEDVTWSQSDTLERTLQAIGRCGLSTATGPEWFDVDSPADLDRLAREGGVPAHTAACLARIKALRDTA